jgi:hypothetical protein
MFEMQVRDGSGTASTQDRFIASSERLFMVVAMTAMTVKSMRTTMVKSSQNAGGLQAAYSGHGLPFVHGTSTGCS